MRRHGFAALLFALVAGGPALAQSGGPAAIPRSAEPGQIERRFERQDVNPQSAFELARPSEAPKVPGPAPVRFVLSGVVIDGATVYPVESFTPLYEKLLAAEISLDDVDVLTAAITRRYRDDGYVLSYAVVPPQNLEFGLLHIQIVEGFIEDVVLTGRIGGDKRILEAYVEKLKAVRPTTIAALERYLLLMSDLAGASVRSAMSRIDPLSGAHRLEVSVGHKELQLYGSLDNRGTRPTGRDIFFGQGVLNSAFGRYEATRLRVSTVPDSPRELMFAELAEDVPIGAEGTKLSFAGSYSRGHPGADLRPFALRTEDARMALRATYPIERRREESLWVYGELFWRNSSEDIAGQPLSADRLRILRGGAQYAVVDALKATNTIAAEFSHGLELFGASHGGALLSRTDGNADFAKVLATLVRSQPLGQSWTVQSAALGQWSNKPLLSSEEIAIGGPGFGRAYDPAELTGAQGGALALELQYALAALGFPTTSLYAFWDWGVVFNAIPGGGTQHDSLSSAGVGGRARIGDHLSLGIELAKPLTRRVALEGDKAPRIFFGIQAAF